MKIVGKQIYKDVNVNRYTKMHLGKQIYKVA